MSEDRVRLTHGKCTLSTCRSHVFQPWQSPPLHAMPACPPFKPGDQLRHEDSPVIFRSSRLNDAIEFPILKHKITLEDKDAQEIHDLFVFLNAHYSGELEDKVGKVHVLSEDAYAKHERLVQLISGLEEEEKFGLIGQLLANVEGVERAEFTKLFAATGGETLRHIPAPQCPDTHGENVALRRQFAVLGGV